MGGWKPVFAGLVCFVLGMVLLTKPNTDIAFLKIVLDHGGSWLAVLLFVAGAFAAAWGKLGDEDSRFGVTIGAIAVALLNVLGLITALPTFAPTSLSMIWL